MTSSVPSTPANPSEDNPATNPDPPVSTTKLISKVARAGNVTRELTATAFEGEYANPSEILPTSEGVTLFRGAGGEQNEHTGHSRRNGWHPDSTLDRVGDWITKRRKKAR